MVNENGVSNVDTAEDKKNKIESAIKNAEDLSSWSNEDLQDFFDEYSKSKDYNAVAAIAKELSSRTEKGDLSPDKNTQEKLAQDAIKQQEDTAKFQQELNQQKQKEADSKQEEIAELTSKLNESNEKTASLQEAVDKLLEAQKQNRVETSQSLEDLLKAKKSGDSEGFDNFLKKLTDLLEKKGLLKDKSQKVELEYPKEEMATLNTRMIRGRRISKKTIQTSEGKETTIKRPNLKLVKHYRTRRRLNKTVKMFNKIGDDPRRGIRYIMAKARKREGGKVGMGFKRLNNRLTIRDIDKFDEVFNKQKKAFIDNLEVKIKSEYKDEKAYKESPDGKTIKAIQDRANYYQKAYKRKFITV